jgi:dTDP-L-rhamnose 4-epimerase
MSAIGSMARRRSFPCFIAGSGKERLGTLVATYLVQLSDEVTVVSESWTSERLFAGAEGVAGARSDGAAERLPADALVLVTGGAGFIGSHLANSLAEQGCRVRVLDSLAEQVHGPEPGFPAHLHADIERVEGDVRDRSTILAALTDVTHVCHLAAAVGVGQSMYEINHYVDVNNRGTAMLLEALLEHPVQKLVVASSMSVYGEGLYRAPGDGASISEPPLRSREQLARSEWELRIEHNVLDPLPTPETKHPSPASIYALTKYDQEQLCLMFGAAYNVPTVALRFFNAYGPYQALSNPYTGVLAIFASRCLNGNPPMIFEDGLQSRDFVSVHDIALACRLALATGIKGEVFNIGSGESRSVLDVARRVIDVLDAGVEPLIAGRYRWGDIRHCYADIGKARKLLGFTPRVRFEDGLRELAEWLSRSSAMDHCMRATAELERRGLTL